MAPFQQIPDEIRALGLKIGNSPGIYEQQRRQPRFSMIAVILVAFIALPSLQTVGEFCGLRPVSATCKYNKKSIFSILSFHKMISKFIYSIRYIHHYSYHLCGRW